MTKIPNNIKSLSASEIGRKLSKQELCPIDLVSFYLDQIQNFNGLSPFIKVFNKEAIQNAILSRDRIKNGKALSLFDGVPIAWKDLFDISGYQTLGGSNLLKNSEKVKMSIFFISSKSNLWYPLIIEVNNDKYMEKIKVKADILIETMATCCKFSGTKIILVTMVGAIIYIKSAHINPTKE